ncbi:MAG TPA: hypothetical protein VG269_05810 [Tepidisphaeraceae bacterium]|nr:hypothetical protein [Tepidisphaeraceae bacterium]
MAEAGGIFERPRKLTPGQLRAVADRRYDDAMCLLNSGENARMNGAMYMGGFVVECLLKAMLLERHSNLQRPVDPAALSRTDHEAFVLLFGHALDEMLVFIPEVRAKLRFLKNADGRPLWPAFQAICEQWTVYARYSPRHAKVEDARRFLITISEA